MARELPPDQVLYYFQHDLGNIADYSEFHERWLAEESARYDEHIQSDTDVDWDRYGNRRGLSASFTMRFPQLGRHALVVYIYSLLEDTLNQFCLAVRRERNLTAELTDAKGKGIRRAKHYICLLYTSDAADE